MHGAPKTTRENWALLAIGTVLVIVGMQVFIIQPAFISALVIARHLTEAWAGYIASSEMSGIAFATIVAAAIGHRLPWRVTTAIGAVVLSGADLASVFAPTPILFLIARAVAGLGAGLFISIGYSAIGMTRNTDRNFGYVIMALLGYGACGVFAMPWALASIGLGGILIALAIMAITPLPLLFLLPQRSTILSSQEAIGNVVARDRSIEYLALAAVATFFLAQGMVWAYLGLIGTAAGLADQTVANGLAISQLAGVLGAFGMAWLSGRVSQHGLLLAGTIGSAVPLLALLVLTGAFSYGTSIVVFNGAANLMTPLLMAIAATAGRGNPLTVQRAAALQMLGLAAGPALAAPIADQYGFAPVLIVSAVLFSVAYVAAQRQQKRLAFKSF
jgi:predicted MFS family arabinose efflux permease